MAACMEVRCTVRRMRDGCLVTQYVDCMVYVQSVQFVVLNEIKHKYRTRTRDTSNARCVCWQPAADAVSVL
jgi:hypothetical protein